MQPSSVMEQLPTEYLPQWRCAGKMCFPSLPISVLAQELIPNALMWF